MRPRYTGWKLALLMGLLLATFAAMAWWVFGNLARARRAGPPGGAPNGAQRPIPPRSPGNS